MSKCRCELLLLFFPAFRFYIRPCANWNCWLRCSMAVVPETCISCLIINLDRLRDRLSRMRDLCKTLQLSEVSRVSAVDGHDLVQRGGRAKRVGKMVWCLCYDDPSAGRIQHPGHLGVAGATNIWCQHAWAMSHKKALLELRDMLDQVPFVLALEASIFTLWPYL